MTPTDAAIRAKVNGRAMDLPSGLTIAALLHRLEIQPALVAVEHNREIVPKSDYESRSISNGDSLEIVHFVGGG
jgi:thiamine biosynthesis protein ThiS